MMVLCLLGGAAELCGQANSPNVRIDQFGYGPDSQKTVILRQAVVGWDAPDSFAPGASLELRRPNGTVAWTTSAQPWQSGAVHSDSGDRVWWGDFSGLTTPGTYVAVDVASGASSEPFEGGDSVYDDVLVQATRMFFYQRCGTAKAAPFAEANWTDSPCHVGPGQDSDCLAVQNPSPGTAQNLSGGWHDAGNYTKYVNFADDALHPLLSAYAARPGSWSDAAELAWTWLAAKPGAVPSSYDSRGFSDVFAEDPADWQLMNQLRTAVHLFGASGNTLYRDWFDNNVAGSHLLQWQFALVWEQELNEALLEYGEIPGATSSVAANIRSIFAASVSRPSHLGHVTTEEDAYRAWLDNNDIGWSSNRTRCLEALMFVNMNHYQPDPANAALYQAAAEDTLHALHGVNPPGLTDLTHMGAYGAADSVNETYHAWFADGSDWDSAASSPFGPPPGILTAGPNPTDSPDPSYNGPALTPPMGQPALKSYRDWNADGPENSWEVTECHIPYQSVYIQLLSYLTSEDAWETLGCALTGSLGEPQLTGGGSLTGGQSGQLQLNVAAPLSPAALLISLQSSPVPFKGGTLKPFPFAAVLSFTTLSDGSPFFPYTMPTGLQGNIEITAQAAISDTAAPAGVSLSNAILGVTF
ncbi:MAG: hypothetical protein ACI9EF_001885 [Pseudohongiellaceae bacterium]|jgi:hypothetical protein